MTGPAAASGYEEHPPRMGFFTDTSVCIGCKACEVACKEWNAVPDDGFAFTGESYDNTGGLGADTMMGGAGDDTYVIDNAGDRIIDDIGAILVPPPRPDHADAAPALARRPGAPVHAAAHGTLGEGAAFETDAGALIALATPGHTADHFAFHWPAAAAVTPVRVAASRYTSARPALISATAARTVGSSPLRTKPRKPSPCSPTSPRR